MFLVNRLKRKLEAKIVFKLNFKCLNIFNAIYFLVIIKNLQEISIAKTVKIRNNE